MPRKPIHHVRRLAREAFGYAEFRPGQAEAIQAVLDGHDTLAILPTGLGKSAIYQLTGLKLDGPTIIISPLIALQRDQVESIQALEIAGAAYLNSTLKVAERREVFAKLQSGELEFLFLAPEQFNNEETLNQLKEARPSLFVIDEAHCISEWGHDFRPDYLRLGFAIEALGHPRVLALTATAAPPVRQQIIECLGMRNPKIVITGFDRPNIWLGVQTFTDEYDKRRTLLDYVSDSQKPGIVYVSTRKKADDVAADLCERGVIAASYHAGMPSAAREKVQAAFMADELEVIVATIAFGMGIDKPNVRFVYHYDISDSVDTYYQEIGRAGRDGEPAEAILFYRAEDMGLHRFFASSGLVDAAEIERVALIIHTFGGPLNMETLREKLELSQSKLMTALTRLSEVGVVELLPGGEVAPIPGEHDLAAAAQQAASLEEDHRRYGQSRLAMMRGYAEVRDCRREYLLSYFGETFDGPCESCDNCEAGLTIERDEENEPFPIHSRVVHNSWGEGEVMRYEGDKMIVLFGKVGYKTLSTEIVTDHRLLAPA